jgi:hypothetical protein
MRFRLRRPVMAEALRWTDTPYLKSSEASLNCITETCTIMLGSPLEESWEATRAKSIKHDSNKTYRGMEVHFHYY